MQALRTSAKGKNGVICGKLGVLKYSLILRTYDDFGTNTPQIAPSLPMKLDRLEQFYYSAFMRNTDKKKPAKVSKTQQKQRGKYLKTVVEPAERLAKFIAEMRKSATSRLRSA